jgi:hypothetical protein
LGCGGASDEQGCEHHAHGHAEKHNKNSPSVISGFVGQNTACSEDKDSRLRDGVVRDFAASAKLMG